jgi:ATP-binding cassette subfamily B protein
MTLREFTVADEYQYDRRSPLRWIVSHVLRYPLLPLVMVIGVICTSSLYSYSMVLVGDAFNLISGPNASGRALLQLALLLLVVRSGVGVVDLLRLCAVELMAQRLERDAREELYISLLGKSQTFHNRQRVGDVMARATNDVQQLNLMISPGASLIFESTVFTIVPLIAIAGLNPQLLLIPVLFIIAFVIALRRYNRELNPIEGALRMQYGKMSADLAESISGIEVVKGYAQEAQEKRRFAEDISRYRDLFVEEGRVKARYLPLLLFGIAFGLAFGHALLLFRAGALNVGEVVAYMGLLGVLRFPTFISLFSFSLVQLGVAGARRILELIQAETELDENAGGIARPIQGAIQFENVSFGYADEARTADFLASHNAAADRPDAPPAARHPSSLVLHNITFAVAPGQTVAIVGQTGAGKTTLTRLVNRTYDASDGRVLIDGADVRDWSLDSLRSQISTIEQDVFLFSRTIAENIAFGAPTTATREQVIQAAKEAQAHDFIMSFPDGYDTIIGERGVTLSGGQRQRIAIARAFMTDPRILILDDSTSAIDSATEDQIQHAMRRIMKGRTTLLITHRLSQIRWADQVIVLRGGEVVAQGTHEDLMRTSEAYRRIFARYARAEPAGVAQ